MLFLTTVTQQTVFQYPPNTVLHFLHFLFFQLSSINHDHDYLSTKRLGPLVEEIDHLKDSYPEFMDFMNDYTKAKETLTVYEAMLSKGQVLSLDLIKENDKMFQYYTGLPSFLVFDALLDYFADKTSNMQYVPLTRSGHTLDPNNPLTPPERQTLSIMSFPERQKTLEIQLLLERLKTPTPLEGVKRLSVQLVKSIQEKINDLPVGGRLKWFLKLEGKGFSSFSSGSHLTGLSLPFREHPKLSRCPCIRFRGSKHRRQSRILQLTVLGPKTRELVETCDRPWLPKPISHSLKVQDGDSRVNLHIPEPGEWVTSIDLSDAYLHLPIHPQSRNFFRFITMVYHINSPANPSG